MKIDIRRPDTIKVKIVDKCIEPDPSKPQTHQQSSPKSGKRKLDHVLFLELPVVADGFEPAVEVVPTVEFTPATAKLDS